MTERNEARCLPEKTGLAAEVDAILAQHARPKPREEPERFELPTEVGVYRATSPVIGEELVQLDETGQWWPYPYMFSGWRNSELSMFQFSEKLDLELDVPEIRNPQLREAIEDFTARLELSFPEVGRERLEAFSREYISEQYD